MRKITIVFCIFFFSISFADIINVPTQHSTIQAGINVAIDGDTVLVNENVYYENINFNGKAITVASHFILDQDTSHISKTIINGSKPANPDSGSVVYFSAGTDTNSVLKGFTITGGTGNIFRPPGFLFDLHYGGGIFIDGLEGACIKWNIIENNLANSVFAAGGGGIASGSPGGPGYTIIENNIINNNEVSGTSGVKDGSAIWMGNSGRVLNNTITGNISHSVNDRSIGAISLSSGAEAPVSKVYIMGNTIKNNKAISEKSYSRGGGVSSYYTTIIMTNNQVENNSLNGNTGCVGAGIIGTLLSKKSRIENNVIKANLMSLGVGRNFYGGGIDLNKSEASIINNTIMDNYGGNSGGGISLYESSPEISSNRIINNFTTYSGGGIACYNTSNPEIKNNLIAYNSAGEDGGGFDFFSNSNPVLRNNTIVENTAKWGGAMAFNSNCNPVIINTIVFGNFADSSGGQAYFWDEGSDPTFLYCDIEGGKNAFGFREETFVFDGQYKSNIDNDPIFEDSLFHLSDSSPCIGKGDSIGCPPKDINGTHRPSPEDTQPDIGACENFLGAPNAIEKLTKLFPNKLLLHQNYPNPFNPKTNINYEVPVISEVDLSIYNILGQKVATLVSKKQPAGTYKVEWDALGFTSGIYFYKLETENGFTQTKKLVLLK